MSDKEHDCFVPASWSMISGTYVYWIALGNILHRFKGY